MLPGVCPGVCNTSAGSEARPMAKPSSALASGGATSGVGTPIQLACISIIPSRGEILLVHQHRSPGKFA